MLQISIMQKVYIRSGGKDITTNCWDGEKNEDSTIFGKFEREG